MTDVPANFRIQTLKEIVRHGLRLVGLGRRPSHLGSGNIRERFSEIYASGVWQVGNDDAPGSGAGSSLQATQNIRIELPRILDTLGAETLLDIGCGDFTWMREVSLSQRYIGADIVPAVIESNTANFSSDRREFHCLDAISGTLPDADAVLCREMLFHLSFADARRALQNILSKPRKFILLTTDGSTGFNRDVDTGDFRLLNLTRRPFGFPTPAHVIDDSFVSPGRAIGVWHAEDIAAALRTHA
eukprot:TRINITY_DN71972_c0_g1_i1.p2 TRINITY_DN71972_c0_g1~~TRINITY_DN71972_c0_g1_i1.p2  ORF type:complete len:244 (+),score=31.34 TRINITY_DN71972_c0_g1_i1:111-842(+)